MTKLLIFLLLMFAGAAVLPAGGLAQETGRVEPSDEPGNLDVVEYAHGTDFRWRPQRLRIDYGDGHGPFDHRRVNVAYAAWLHWSCPHSRYGPGQTGALLVLPWHPDTAAFTYFNSVRIWWLMLIDRYVVSYDVEVVIGNEPVVQATVERLQASPWLERPPLQVHLPHRAVSRMLLSDGPFELRLRGEGIDAWYWFGRPEPERVDETARRRLQACARG